MSLGCINFLYVAALVGTYKVVITYVSTNIIASWLPVQGTHLVLREAQLWRRLLVM
jgi:hypothetical protein